MWRTKVGVVLVGATVAGAVAAGPAGASTVRSTGRPRPHVTVPAETLAVSAAQLPTAGGPLSVALTTPAGLVSITLSSSAIGWSDTVQADTDPRHTATTVWGFHANDGPLPLVYTVTGSSWIAGRLITESEQVTQAGLPAPYAVTVDWVPPGTRLGTYGNVRAQLGDCVVAAAANWTQLEQHSPAPLPSGPFVASYERLLAQQFPGVTPGPYAGLLFAPTLQAWATPGEAIGGSSIAGYTPVPTDQADVEAALRTGPVLVGLEVPVPPPGGETLPFIQDAFGYFPAWNEDTVPPPIDAPPGASQSSHAALAVGYNSGYVFLATWGGILPVAWPVWNAQATAAWAITPAPSTAATGAGA